MNMFNMNKPFKAGSIYIKGNSKPLKNRQIFITNSFLIVSDPEGNKPPTWYNIDQINKIEGVEMETQKQQIAFF